MKIEKMALEIHDYCESFIKPDSGNCINTENIICEFADDNGKCSIGYPVNWERFNITSSQDKEHRNKVYSPLQIILNRMSVDRL